MIQRLRLRFVLTAMLSMLAVLSLIIGGMNVINYQSVLNDADEVLQFLSDNYGVFPSDSRSVDQLPPGDADMTNAPEVNRQPDSSHGAERGFRKGSGRLLGFRTGRLDSAEIEFETRYFTVILNSDGQCQKVTTDHVSAVTETEAETYAIAAFNSGANRGFLDQYRYLRSKTDEGTMIIFLDCTLALNAFQSFLIASSLTSLVGFICVFLLILLLSKIITKPAAESYEKQKRFITDASHELKTPLSIIRADAEVLEMDVGESEWLADIQQQVTNMTELTNALVTLSRMEEDRSQFAMAECSLSDLVFDICTSFQALAVTQQKAFKTDIQPMITLTGDEKALRQLTSILLDNALKYSPQGGSVRVTLKKQGKTVKLIVYNTAEDVKTQDLRRLFDRFYRADASRNSATGGHGIGLSVAHAIVTAHKGKIAATSEDGQSMTMTVTLFA
ncbi:MAG: HAMP domain-containing histidine kinase [Clostridia bacterium]|nr:HAMP domain-containing histidine kinase [Clostridia bacterium]